MKPQVYVVKNWRGQWVVRISGQYQTQDGAEAVGRSVARALKTEFVLKSRTGRIRKRDSYGNDPRRSKG